MSTLFINSKNFKNHLRIFKDDFHFIINKKNQFLNNFIKEKLNKALVFKIFEDFLAIRSKRLIKDIQLFLRMFAKALSKCSAFDE